MKERDGIRTAILISGGGTTMEAIIKAYKEGEIKGVVPVVVISDNPDAVGLGKADALGIPTEVVPRKEYKTRDEYGDVLLQKLKAHHVDFMSQNGLLSFTPDMVTSEVPGINQHNGPLDPGREGKDAWSYDFGGNKMYGARVVASRIAYSWATDTDYWTESTVHHVRPGQDYDSGNLISIVRCSFDRPDLPRHVTIASLERNPEQLMKYTEEFWKATLLPLEHKNVVAVLQMLGEDGLDNLPDFPRSKPLVPAGNRGVVLAAKNLAVKLYPPEK